MLNPLRRGLPHPLRKPGNPIHGGADFGLAGGGPAPPVGFQVIGPTIFDLQESVDGFAVDIYTSKDCLILFGDSTLTLATYDLTYAMSYPATSIFDSPSEVREIVGPPQGATRFLLYPLLGSTQVSVRMRPRPEYGGFQMAHNWAVADTILQGDLNAPITALPVTIIQRALVAVSGVVHPFVQLLQAADVANNVPRLESKITGANVWLAVFQKTGALSNVSAATGMGITLSEWVTTISTFTDAGGGVVLPTMWRWGVTFGEDEAVGASPVETFSGTYTRVSYGYPHATGQAFLSIGDRVARTMVLNDTLTKIQKQQFGGDPCPPWELLVPDPTKIRFNAPGRQFVPRREWTRGRDMTVSVGTSANVTAVAYNGPVLRGHNRIVAHDVNGVLKPSYSNVRTGTLQLPTRPSSLYRSEQRHKLRYDIGTAPNATVNFQTVDAGVPLLYGAGDVLDIDEINDSGVAGDVGTQDLHGLEYIADYYSFISDIGAPAISQTSGTVAYVSSARTGNFRITKPASGSGWPMVVFAVGAGGLHTEYDDLAVHFARRGYCFVVLSFHDEGQSGPTFGGLYIWGERIGEYSEFFTDWIVPKVGYAPTEVFIAGHSGGATTAAPAAGLIWYSNNNTIPHSSGLLVPSGGGVVKGMFQMSAQGADTGTQPGFQVRSTSWNSLSPSLAYMWMVGASENGETVADGNYPWRLSGYDSSPSTLRKIKAAYLNGHHLFGGACTDQTDGSDPSLPKMRQYTQRLHAMDQMYAFCEGCRGVSAGFNWLVNRAPVADPSMLVVYNTANI